MHGLKINIYSFFSLFILLFVLPAKGQVNYGATIAVGLNKIVPSYTGNSIQVRRACDNATVNIGFNSCGDLDTVALSAFAGLPVFPLTSLTATASAAYSLRKVRCAYSGSAIRVRSTAAGSPTVDIGFTVNGDLDTAALKTFVGSNSAFVITWYDQSGNARNVTQTIAANQPRIVNAGVVARQNGKPAINFMSASSTSLFLNVLLVTDKISVSTVAKINSASTRNTLFDLGAIPSGYSDFAFESNTWMTAGNKWGYYSNNNSLDGTVSTSTNLTLLSLTAQNTYTASANLIANTNFYVNGAASTLSCRSCVTSTYRASWLNGFTIGNFNGAYVSYLDGFISELIVFPSVLSTTERQFLEWTQAQYYSVTTGVALGTLPSGTLPSAFVATWYDQSGSGKNLTQTANTKQPQIINNGVVIKLGTRPATQGSTSLQAHLSTTFTPAYTANVLSANTVVQPDVTSSANNRVMSVGNTAMTSADWSNTNYFNINLRNTNQFVIERSGVTPATNITAGSPLVFTVRFDGANRQLFNNGTGSATATDANAFNFNSIRVLHSINPGYEAAEGLQGKMAAFSMYYSSLSTTRRVIMESNQAAYYNITLANNKYTAPSSASYINFVNGIGRTSATDTVLGTRQTVGMGVSATTAAGNFLQSDGDYLMYGINCPLGPSTSTANLPSLIVRRWTNDWYVDKTDVGTAGGTIRMFFDFFDYGYTAGLVPGAAADYELLYRAGTSGNYTIVSGTTKSVTGDRVFFVVNATAISDGYYTIGTRNDITSPLPVELLYFNAVKNQNQVNINWATASEKDNDYYTIEKSRDAVNFIPLKTVSSKAVNGNSQVQLNYNDVDENPFAGVSYYRLKQTDFDGVSKYSAIVDVDFGNAEVMDMIVYPNPNPGNFMLSFYGFKSSTGTMSITITDALGKKVYNSQLSVSANENNFQIAPLEKLAKGIYIITCVVDDKPYTKKLVVN